jgi:DNA primase
VISDEIIERVRTAADIVQILSEFVPLKRAGGDYRGPCPFHGGTNPNFSVSPKRGSYHCFVCHESGDVFSFVRKRLGLDWPSAVKMIGERVGIEVVDVPMRAQAPDPNAPNFEVLAAAAEWFQRQLTEDAGGREARAYLKQRQLDESAWERFGLGFAPRDLLALRRYLHSLGADDARLIEAGLFVVREGENEPRPRFRGRLMFPILDELGRHVGFGGRALGDDTPKYLNSPESAVFQKRKTLYNMHTAKQAMRRAGRAIVVEGYLDAIRLVLAGIEEVVAPLGTALTDEQAQLLVRYASEVFLLYDSDDAGQKATFRSGLELLGHKASVRVVDVFTSENPKAADPAFAASLANPVTQQVNSKLDGFDWALEIGFLPGVTDNIGHTASELLSLIGASNDNACYSSRLYLIKGNLKESDVQALAAELSNKLIQRATIKDAKAFKKDGGMGAVIPKVTLSNQGSVADKVNLNVADAELEEIGNRGIKNADGSRRGPLGMSLLYMKAVQDKSISENISKVLS